MLEAENLLQAQQMKGGNTAIPTCCEDETKELIMRELFKIERKALAGIMAKGLASAVFAVPLMLSAIITASATDPHPIEGIWLTKDGESHVKIVRCEESLCNEIIWLKNPNDKKGQPLKDNLNKNQAKRGRPIMGMPIMENMKQVSKVMWRGRLYKPRHGKTYAGHARLINDKKLELKGCHSVFPVCQTQIWNKVRDLEAGELQTARE